MQLVVKTIGLTNKLKYCQWIEHGPKQSISMNKIDFDG
jgi:hypothetical protein